MKWYQITVKKHFKLKLVLLLFKESATFPAFDKKSNTVLKRTDFAFKKPSPDGNTSFLTDRKMY